MGPFRTPSPDLAKSGFLDPTRTLSGRDLKLAFGQIICSPGAYLESQSGPWYLPGPGLGPQIGSPPHGRALAAPGSWTPLIGVSEPGSVPNPTGACPILGPHDTILVPPVGETTDPIPALRLVRVRRFVISGACRWCPFWVRRSPRPGPTTSPQHCQDRRSRYHPIRTLSWLVCNIVNVRRMRVVPDSGPYQVP